MNKSYIARIVVKCVEFKPYGIGDRIDDWAKEAKVLQTDLDKLKTIFNHELNQAEQTFMQRHQLHSDQMGKQQQQEESSSLLPSIRKRKREEGNVEIVSRRAFGNAKTSADKLGVLKDCWAEVQSCEPKSLKEADRTFYRV